MHEIILHSFVNLSVKRKRNQAMLHRFDLHVHSYFSSDAAGAPEELIVAARAKGLSGIAITDHDTCEAHDYLIEKGLERPDGQPAHGFLVVPGVEVSTADGHLLCIGVTLPPMRGEPAADVVKAIEDRGGVAIPSHPYDHWRAGIPEVVLDTLGLKALEVFNAAAKKEYNERALAYATRRGLSMTASSDAHHASAVATSSTAFELDELSVPRLVIALRKGGVPEGRYLSLQEAFKKQFGSWLRPAHRKLS
ncbi:MAG TPA: PHP domain-containing protein [Terrimicrobiaceae bacterium]|nr:PHP domain-containing protein [Terrimicrobiaceae bacterium]